MYWKCFFLIFPIFFCSQNIVLYFPSMFGSVFIELSGLCFDQKSKEFYRLVSEFLGGLAFSSGIGTVLQVTFGNRYVW